MQLNPLYTTEHLKDQVNELKTIRPSLEEFVASSMEDLRKILRESIKKIQGQFDNTVLNCMMPRLLVKVEEAYKESQDLLENKSQEVLKTLDAAFDYQFEKFDKIIQTITDQLLQSGELQHKFGSDMNQKIIAMTEEQEKLLEIKTQLTTVSKVQDPDIVEVNVGGSCKLTASREILCQVENSALQLHFQGRSKTSFVDRDPKAFTMLVNYMRSQRKITPAFANDYEKQLFYHELAFWGVDQEQLTDKTIVKLFGDFKVPNTFYERPYHDEETAAVWSKLGPLKILEVHNRSPFKIDFAIKYKARNYLNGAILVHGQDIQGEPQEPKQVSWDTRSEAQGLEAIVEEPSHSEHNVVLESPKGPASAIYLARVSRLDFELQEYCLYEGQMFNNMRRHGFGRSIKKNGEWHIGFYDEDKQHGPGRARVMVDGQFQTIEATWFQGE